MSASYPVLAYADLTLNLKDPSGTVVATSRSASGSTGLTYLAASGGSYTLGLANNSADLTAPTYTATTRAPRTHHASTTLVLKDKGGVVVAGNTSSARPKTLNAPVLAGQYTLLSTATGGSGTATLTASYSAPPQRTDRLRRPRPREVDRRRNHQGRGDAR
ncbi:MAG: hypothetical protein ACRD0M_03845, partial [Acidimicrobiales bacterium]